MHEETVRIVDAQMSNMSKQMEALDDFVTKARSRNGVYHEAHLNSLGSLSTNVRQSYMNFNDQMGHYGGRIDKLRNEFTTQSDAALESVAPLTSEVRRPLSQLGTNIRKRPLQDYMATGKTPQKTSYEYPTTLPQTEPHESLIARMKNAEELSTLPFSGVDQLSPMKKSHYVPSPSKTYVYNDSEDEVGKLPPANTTVTSSNTGLREIDTNVAVGPIVSNIVTDASVTFLPPGASREKDGHEKPPLKRHCSSTAMAESKLPHKPVMRHQGGLMEGRENIPISITTIGQRVRRPASD